MRTVPVRTALIGCSSLTLLAGGLTATMVTAHAATAGCRVSYSVGSQWTGGFTANVAVTNLGDPLTSWRLAWSFGAGQTVTQAWNATVDQIGASVTAANASWNGNLASGASTSFGFNGSWTGGNPVPTDFALNGVPCTGGTTPNPTPSTNPTGTRPSPSPTT